MHPRSTRPHSSRSQTDVTLSFRSGCHAQMTIALLLYSQRVTALQEVTLSFPILSRRIPHFPLVIWEDDGDLASKTRLDRRARRNGFNQHTSRLHRVGWGQTQGWGVPDCILQGALELYSVKVTGGYWPALPRQVAAYLLGSTALTQNKAQHWIKWSLAVSGDHSDGDHSFLNGICRLCHGRLLGRYGTLRDRVSIYKKRRYPD